MKTAMLILAAAILAAPCLAGTNVTIRVIEDNHGGNRWQVYSHGTNAVLKIHLRGKKTSITSQASGYSVTHSDDDGDGVTDSIMILKVKGGILEILRRSKDSTYSQTPQDDLDEMNKLAKQIESRIPKQQ
jgi:hypothetical protein